MSHEGWLIHGAQELYGSLPPWAQTVALNAYAAKLHLRRRGHDFRRLVERWEESQWWEPERIRAWQDSRVAAIVRYAYERVPYYRERWDEVGVDPRSVEGVADLARLPILEKEDVRAAGDALVASKASGLAHGHTSGTTGSPLSLRYDRAMSVANEAADRRQKQWAGMEEGDWCGLFLGRVVVPTDREDPPYWRTNFLHRQVWFSSFHLHPENLDAYVREIRHRGLRFLEGYPSTLFIVARHLLDRSERLPMRAVLTSSETLHRVQRQVITEAFGCEIFDFYGLAERVIFAGECERHHGKHLFQEYGVTELVDDEGRPVEPGETGWLTGTTLWNRGMPLIRYRTSDLSRELAACSCGRGLRCVTSVTTKAEDIVVTPEGRLVSPSVLTHPFKPFEEIHRSQIVQAEVDRLRIRLVVDDGFGDREEERLRASLTERVGTAMRLDFEYVDVIPPEPSGKYRWVVSRVSHSCDVPWVDDSGGPAEHPGGPDRRTD